MTAPATTLSAAIANGTDTTCSVRDVVGFATSAESDDLVQIGAEYLLVSGGLGTTSWTSITRGYAGSTAAAHIDGSTVTRLERKYTDASRLQVLSKAGSADYAYLQTCAEAANSWLISEVGRFFGPSTDTSRTFDVLRPSNELQIAGGLRSFSKVEIKTNSASSTWVEITTDCAARPMSWDRLDGLEADRLTLTDFPTLGYRTFPVGYAVARVTGVFGPATPPSALRAIADTVGWWRYQSRGAGMGGSISTDELVADNVLQPGDWRTLKLYRGVGPSLYAMPAF